jgi:hypothetical protein
MSNFRNWYVRNQDMITGFIMGWLCMSCIDNISRGNYIWAALEAGLVYVNYKMGRMQ